LPVVRCPARGVRHVVAFDGAAEVIKIDVPEAGLQRLIRHSAGRFRVGSEKSLPSA